MTTAIQLFTLQEFLQLPNINESPSWELFNQVPSQKPMPTLYHSRLQKRLVSAIDDATNAYEAFPELRCVLSESSVVPDITVIHRDRIPTANEAVKGSPDWGIEILSPHQSTTRVIAKIQLCLQEGMELGWLIDCTEEVVLVLQRDRTLGVFRGKETLPVPAAIPLHLTPQEILTWVL